ncbi:glycosyltransferase family 4 protein [Lutibacter sp.]|uniref:glycosyltransferase family 4 protein n=1 Tax=Lutibacter sp. TaxID=1925666 RepID=UPI0025BA0A8C|nr:glycosyltransferase family 4 protein [Lutibacter sp.]MCF6181362.1 glycosyltransferase family 4 protein [Lutibacter sp.]
MNLTIALCHFRVGETDGVSLEMDKWKAVLEKMGYQTHYIAGSEGLLSDVHIIEELHYNNAINNMHVENAYVKFHSFPDEWSFKESIGKYAKSVEKKLIAIINKNNIDVLIVNNIFSLGWNLAAGIGFYNAIKKTSVKCICHHHDFYWEREKYSNPTCSFVQDYLDEYFPPIHPRIKHVVINSIAKNKLKRRKNIESTIVPNVFNFDNDWKIDNYNEDFRASFGIKNNDLIILQATRIVKRKGIELAIDFVSELTTNKHQLIGKKLYNNKIFDEKSSIIFLWTGLNEDESYFNQIVKYAKKKNVTLKIVSNYIDHERSFMNNVKKYSLWDAYANCDMVTYTSLLEGWGNQFIEALVAKKIIISYQYPVFEKDILPLNFNTIDLGNMHTLKEDGLAAVLPKIIENASNKTIDILLSKAKYSLAVNKNYNIGRQNLSLETLETKLKSILENEK